MPTLALSSAATVRRAARPSAEQALLALLLLITVAAAAGYAAFALHPDRLRGVRNGAAIYATAMRVLPWAHVIAGLAALVAILVRRTGAAWIPSALALYAISLASELAGTTTGLPFGPYRYTDGLGIKWFAHVPLLIPASWFMMALPSFALATRWVASHGVLRLVVAAALLVAWDLVLDPAMSHLVPLWIWGRRGPFYGMPLTNLVGWYVTGLALMLALDRMHADDWLARVPTMPLLAVYTANLALPMLMVSAAGLWLPAILAALPIALTAGGGAVRRSAA